MQLLVQLAYVKQIPFCKTVFFAAAVAVASVMDKDYTFLGDCSVPCKGILCLMAVHYWVLDLLCYYISRTVPRCF